MRCMGDGEASSTGRALWLQEADQVCRSRGRTRGGPEAVIRNWFRRGAAGKLRGRELDETPLRLLGGEGVEGRQ